VRKKAEGDILLVFTTYNQEIKYKEKNKIKLKKADEL